ncbi:MAG: anthranilate synthase component 1 [Succinivibrio sp.]|nr:anthranilate synthase component 1 [Succinivibrio sp.]
MRKISFKTKYLKDAQAFYQSLGQPQNTVLLESAEIVAKTGVRSLIGTRCALKLSCEDLKVTVQALNLNGQYLLRSLGAALCREVSGDCLCLSYTRPPKDLDEDSRLKYPGPFEVMRKLQGLIRDCRGIFISGVIAFDYINNFEEFGNLPKGINPCSDYTFYVFDLSVKVNHVKHHTKVNAFAFAPEAYQDTAYEALSLRDRIEAFQAPSLPEIKALPELEFRPDLNDEEFGRVVQNIKEHIIRGDAFQVVPSRTFSAPCPNPALSYAYLKRLNPSPYMYYIADPEFTIFGASPEFAVRFDSKTREVRISPIAGTRTRGLKPDGSVDTEIDSRIELELRTDKKEVAEHLMLVDLARNDLARIAKSGTRYVDNLLHVDKYQAVMHLVSDVHATLRDDLDCLHAYQACMNMGTLSGAPKHMAHELIYRYEGKKRGSYGGCIAILDADGSFDSCITIRSALVKGETAYVQAGCGVVFDSDIQAECQETANKARSVLLALKLAQTQH